MHVDRNKLAELMLYVAQKSESDPKFGATKLYKILYFADTMMWQRTGRSISGAEYVRWPHGPVPSDGEQVKDLLVQQGDARLDRADYAGHEQLRLVANREADLTMFTVDEIDAVDEVMRDLQHMNASEVSELSHGPAWQLARENEVIPYEASLLSDKPFRPSKADLEWARAMAAR